jgi:hypothetical protein
MQQERRSAREGSAECFLSIEEVQATIESGADLSRVSPLQFQPRPLARHSQGRRFLPRQVLSFFVCHSLPSIQRLYFRVDTSVRMKLESYEVWEGEGGGLLSPSAQRASKFGVVHSEAAKLMICRRDPLKQASVAFLC